MPPPAKTDDPGVFRVYYDGIDLRPSGVTPVDELITTRMRICRGQGGAVIFAKDNSWLLLGCAESNWGKVRFKWRKS